MAIPCAVPGAIARPQLPTWATLSSTARIRRVPDEGAPELVGVLAHRLRQLVDHQLPRRRHVGAVDVAHRAGVERVVLVDLVEQLRDDAEVVGHVRGQAEDRLRVAEVRAGQGRASVALSSSPNPWLKSVATLVWRWSKVSTLPPRCERPHARGDHRVHAALAEVVGAVPHQLHRLAQLLARWRRPRRRRRRTGGARTTRRPAPRAP